MRFIRHHLFSLGALATALFAALIIQGSFAQRIDPAEVSQEKWFRLAQDDEAEGAQLPEQHVVVFERADKEPWAVILSYLPPPVGRGGRSEVQGLYDQNTGRIVICGDMSVLQAGLPDTFQPLFRATLRHEYGHALFDDWMKREHADDTSWYCAARVPPVGRLDPHDSPDALHLVIEDYNRAPRDIYGLPHFTSTFDEYIAQSYARFVSGAAVPKHTQRFLEEAIHGG